jgi:hypothetical protein
VVSGKDDLGTDKGNSRRTVEDDTYSLSHRLWKPTIIMLVTFEVCLLWYYRPQQ